MEKKKLFFITRGYPLNDAEAPFINPEFPYLKEKFDVTLIILPYENLDAVKGRGYEYIIYDEKVGILKKIAGLLRFLLCGEFRSEMWALMSEKQYRIKNIYRACMFGAYGEIFYRNIRKRLGMNKNTDAVFYFYWWDFRCLGFTLNKSRHPRIKIVTRTHNCDLYDERELYGRQFFKKQMAEKLDRVYFIAKYGKRYFLERYKLNDCRKFQVRRLGVTDPEPDVLKDNRRKDEITLVSCSYAVMKKRVDLIVKGLALIQNIRINWIHFGDGDQLENIQVLAKNILQENISCQFRGHTDNKDILSYYRQEKADCFITTTSIEGCPVSVQEALSFGLPVIGTSVCEIPYMIDGNGVLLSENPKDTEIAEAITYICRLGREEYIKLRKRSYEIYRRDYDCAKNHKAFVEDLAAI